MKTLFIKIFVSCLCMSLMAACQSIVSGLSEDPNNPTDVAPELLLTTMQLGDVAVHEGHTARVAGIWSGYFTGIQQQYKDFQLYNAGASTFSLTWIGGYWLVLEHEKLIGDRAMPMNNRWLTGIAKVIKAHTAGTITACWGDVPYSQASDNEHYPDPVFDPQKEVYAQIQTLLSDAIDDLSSGQGSDPKDADIFLKGNQAKWIAAAHTLKARFYMDVKDYENAYNEALLGIKSADGSVLAPHNTAFGSQNFYSYGRSVTDITSQDAYITRLLDSDSDLYRGNIKTNETARFNYYFTYSLLPNGKKTIYRPNTLNTSNTKGIFATTASFSLITFQENLLILAETGLRTKGLATGLAHLNTHRQFLNTGGYLDPTYKAAGNFRYEPYAASDFAINGLLNKPGIAPEQALLKEILLERYVTFFGQKLGFNDLRRTQKETAGVKIPINIGDKLPQRFIYSVEEINANSNAPFPIPGIFKVTQVNE